MNDAYTFRQQIPTSTDPDRLEREALRQENMTLRLSDPSQGNIMFSVGSGPVLTMKSDGKIERGPGLSDDEATAAFLDCLSRYCPTFLAELRFRAERAESSLEEAKRHIEALTAFFMDNVNWVRASNEARAFARSVTKPEDGGGREPGSSFSGVSG